MTKSLKIERQDFTLKDSKVPDYLTDKVSSNHLYMEVKRDLDEIFSAFFHSEEFESADDADCYRILHYSFNKLLDDMFLSIHNRQMNHVQEKINLYKREKEEPLKS